MKTKVEDEDAEREEEEDVGDVECSKDEAVWFDEEAGHAERKVRLEKGVIGGRRVYCHIWKSKSRSNEEKYTQKYQYTHKIL